MWIEFTELWWSHNVLQKQTVRLVYGSIGLDVMYIVNVWWPNEDKLSFLYIFLFLSKTNSGFLNHLSSSKKSNQFYDRFFSYWSILASGTRSYLLKQQAVISHFDKIFHTICNSYIFWNLFNSVLIFCGNKCFPFYQKVY